MLRQIIGAVLGALFIFGAVTLSSRWIANKNKPKPVLNKVIKTVYVTEAKNGAVPIFISAQGNLTATRRIALYAEVQGLLLSSSRPFKTGQYFQKGEYLMRLNSREFYADLKAQRSQFQDLLTTMMPDLRMDYPEAFVQWDKYLRAFDIDHNLPPLPKPASDKENYFIMGRNIVSTYYQVKNLEERYAKYTIRAPFDGILTSAMVTEGTLVRVGQQLGEFIDPSHYELEVSVNSSYANLLKIGKEVDLQDLEGRQKWVGTVKRIGGNIDLASQTLKVYIHVKGTDLREGMYLEASLKALDEQDAFTLNRKLLVGGNSVFVVKDNSLHLEEIEPVFFSSTDVVVKGLENGTSVVTKPVPGAYEGMAVKIAESTPELEQSATNTKISKTTKHSK